MAYAAEKQAPKARLVQLVHDAQLAMSHATSSKAFLLIELMHAGRVWTPPNSMAYDVLREAAKAEPLLPVREGLLRVLYSRMAAFTDESQGCEP